MPQIARARHTYSGTVQGVGFRPTVYRCAISLGLTGYVRNERSVVVVEVQGPPSAVAGFPDTLRRALPPAARIDHHTVERVPPQAREVRFRIQQSMRTAYTLPPIPPDLAICADCAREVLNPEDRRYLYPFTSCTQCGPRYTVVRDTPFDRANTSMADFPLCAACQREYEDPEDRRFHAQIMACPTCGPTLRLRDSGGRTLAGDPLVQAIRVLADGGTVALLGLGGFHLAADPRREQAVSKLRRDKDRERKPFALMVRDMEAARELVELEPEDEELLTSHAAPILIAPAHRQAAKRLRAVSDTGTLGIMLPYTPLHLLLFRHPALPIPYRALVMTSGNLRDEPIITDPGQAMAQLSGMTDVFLVHDRAVVFRTDDTVVRPARAKTGLARPPPSARTDSTAPSEPTPTDARRAAPHDPSRERRPATVPVYRHILIRRSRGHVPGTLRLAQPVPQPTLAVGGDLKSAPALAVGADVYLAPHVGDLDSLPARKAFEHHIAGMLGLYHVDPAVVVHDAHPGYVSTRWAVAAPWGRKVAVQHHHAHILSVLAEHGLEQALGLSFDGTGYGEDGTIWGGEFLEATRGPFRRLGCFAPFLLVGGDEAVRHPLRIAYALLHGVSPRAAASLALDPTERDLLDEALEKRVSTVMTSSLGRIFDAAAAVLGLVRELGYEGEGPIRLEALATSCRGDSGHELPLRPAPADPAAPAPRPKAAAPITAAALAEAPVHAPEAFVLDAAPTVARMAELASAGEDPAAIARAFHEAVAGACALAALRMREITGRDVLAASGGVFQNALLRSLLFPMLQDAGFQVLTNLAVPPGDGGLALGQLWARGEA